MKGQRISDKISRVDSAPPTVYGFGHQELYDRVARFFLAGEEQDQIIDGLEGWKSVELLEVLYKSNDESREITLPL